MIWIVYDKERIKKNKDFAENLINLLKDEDVKAKLVFAENVKKYKKFPKIAIMRTDNYKISKYLEEKNVTVCNNSKVAEICNDKYKTYQYLKENDIDVLETNELQANNNYKFPIVVKSKFGHGGKDVFLANNYEELLQIAKQYKKNDLIFQPLADKGKDKRTYVINNQIIVSMLRTSDVDFRSNFSLGGKAELTTLTKKEKILIDKVLTLFDFDFAGIDIIYKNHKPYINEIEDVVGSRMVYKNTNIDIVKKYIDYIERIYKDEI